MFSSKKQFSSLAAGFCMLLIYAANSRADLKYEQTTQVSGAMIDTMKKIPFMGKKLGGDMATVHYLKGNSMRVDTYMNGKMTQSEMTLLDREQIIHVDHERKTYSVMTFAQMREAMEKGMAQMNQTKNKRMDSNANSDVKIQPKISVKDTGETKVINGYNTRHMIMTLTIETQDQKTGQKGTMDIVSDLWITKEIPAFNEQRDFYLRMAEKMGTAEMGREAMGMMSGMMQDPKMTEGMAELKKESAKMEGTPILTTTSMNMAGASAGSPPPQSQSQQSKPTENTSKSSDTTSDSVKDAAIQETVGKSLGKVFGGGFGGFGKKKKPAPAPAEPAPASKSSTTETAQGNAPAAGAEPFMKTTMEMKNISASGVSGILFDIPSGYKQVEK
jgi:hypothetical protein